MPTPAQLEDRRPFCESLLRAGPKVVMDGADHSKKVNRCLRTNGEVVGYYAILTDYNSQTDSFNNGSIPAGYVEEIKAYDSYYKT